MNQETQMILRVPEELASQISKMIEEQGDEADYLELKPKIVKNDQN